MTDRELLHEYLEYTSDKAFTDLIRRHVDLVYWTSRRDSGSARIAEAATQDVFSLLAHKAGSINDNTSLVDWLFERSRMMTKNVLIRELRDGQPSKVAEDKEGWEHIAPVVNDAVAGLSQMDREVLLLRIFEDRELGEVGAEIGTTDDATLTRLQHALMSTAMQLESRGVTLDINGLEKLLKENGAPYTSIKVEYIAQTALGSMKPVTPSIAPVAAQPAPIQATALPRRNVSALVAMLVTIAVLITGGLLALKSLSTQPTGKATAGVTTSGPDLSTTSSASNSSTPGSTASDPFAPKPDSAAGSVPLYPPTASTQPAAPAKPSTPSSEVPTDANGIVIGPGGNNRTVPSLPSTMPQRPPVPTPTPAASTPITHVPQEKLMGVVTGASPSAVMEIDGSERIVSMGTTVGDGKVTDIADDHVTITSPNGQSRTITLSTGR